MRSRLKLDNWAGTYRYRARRLHRPTSIDEARDLIARLPRVRILGSRHSFTDIADSDELISLDGVPRHVELDRRARTVSFGGAIRYGELAQHLNDHRLALPNLASLPHISVAGAVATATHGSGQMLGNLASSVAGLQIITSDGEIVEPRRGEPDFEGMVVGLGALGAVTRVTLDVKPAFEVSQRVYEGLSWDTALSHFDEIEAAGYSVSLFTRWDDAIDQVWIKRRTDDGRGDDPHAFYEARAATGQRHPIAGMDPRACTPQLGMPGRWSDRLPHFGMAHTPSAGEEVQSEFLLPRRHAIQAIEAVRRLAHRFRSILQVSELRLVAADDLWMSPQYGTDTLAIHFTWVRDVGAVTAALPELEAVLESFDARPHWGKLFTTDAERIASVYERRGDFLRLAERLDRRGAFRNSWFERTIIGSPQGP
jgi:alditol oxidase